MPVVVVDDAFKDAGKKVGIEIWRIKEFKVTPVPKEDYGYFYCGDSYIVLSTKPSDEWDVHFWLGNDSSQTEGAVGGPYFHAIHMLIGNDSTPDEYGAAAMKTVELDDLLGGGPVQYREIQEYETPLFLSYFKSGIKYLKGGFQSGFKRTSIRQKWTPRLYHCKGKRVIRCKQVDLSRQSLNQGDVFILDNRDDIYVWCPPESGRLERQKGIEVASNIRDQNWCGKANVHVLDQDWNNHETFWRLVGGKGPVKSAADGGKDLGHWVKEKPLLSLWKVSDASGELQITKVAEGTITMDMLDSKDAFILDAASGGIFVWIGKECTKDERTNAMKYAAEYLKMKDLPKSTQVVRVLDSGQPPAVFAQWFATKKDKNAGILTSWQPRLYECSDESGRLTVLEIADFKQKDLDDDDVMILDAREVIYVWVGHAANANEKKAAQETAKKFLSNDALPRPLGAKIVTIVEGSETSEFKKCFKEWDPKFFQNKETFEDMKKSVTAGKK